MTNLPKVLAATAFDRFNGTLCTLTLEAPVSDQVQARLKAMALGFKPGCVSGQSVSRYYLEFDQGRRQVFVRQRCDDRGAPTRDEFTQLLNLLGIELPPKPEPQEPPHQGSPSRSVQVAAVTA